MKHFLLKCMLLSASIVAFANPASAALITIETFTVNSAQASPTFSTSLLSLGVMHTVEVSGFYLFNNFPGLARRQADAEYVTEDFFQTFTNSVGSPSLDLLIVYGSSIGTPFFNSAQNLSAQEVDWGPFNPNHVYSLEVLGNGDSIGLVISDHWPDGGAFSQNGGVFDNSGSLTVRLMQSVPETVHPVAPRRWSGGIVRPQTASGRIIPKRGKGRTPF